MSVCKNGVTKMMRIVEVAPGDISRRLWTLYWLVRMTQHSNTVVELGVRRGDSTRALLAACEDCGSNLYSYDIENVGEHVKQVTAEYGIPWFNAFWSFHHFASVEAGKMWSNLPVDMVFIDTDHTFETTKAEIATWSPHVRVGGCMAFHDYWLKDAPRDGVKPAVDEWANANPDSWLLETHDSVADTGFAILWRRS